MSSNVNPTMAGAPGTIVVVESDVLIRSAVCSYLRECDFRVIEAINAGEAIAVLKHLSVDIILSAVELSGPMNGFSLAQWVRARKPGPQIVLVGTATGAVNAAVNLCDSSPSSPESHQAGLLQHINRLLAESKSQCDASTQPQPPRAQTAS
jgi:CheY-like chemotaxis protein